MDTVLVTPRSGTDSRAAAMARVYEAHAEQIYKFLFFKLGTREDAEDATSQVFMKAAVWLDLSQDARTTLAWLYQVARTCATDHWRHYYKTLASSLDQLEEQGELELEAEPVCVGDASPDPARLSESLLGLLALLPANYRRVLELRFLEGRSLRQTAEVLRLKEGNVRVLQHRALQRAASLALYHNLYRFL